MGSIFTFNVYQTVENDSVLKKLNSIIKTLGTMPTKTEYQAAIAEITGSLDNLAGDVQRLTEQLQTGGMTASEEAEVYAQLLAVAAKAKEIADATPETTVEAAP